MMMSAQMASSLLPKYLADVLLRHGHFGWIPPQRRTQAQHDAHARIVAVRPKLYIPGFKDPGNVKVILTDAWKRPECVADMGMEFIGFHQLTGSCVGVSAGDAISTLSCIQRMIAANPTKAMIPWWGFFYGRTRLAEGDHGQGEGAVDSVMGATLKEGVFDITQSGLPKFSTDDGLYLTSNIELEWSDGASIDSKWLAIAKQFPLGGVATINDVAGIRAAIINGYPVLDGCFVSGTPMQLADGGEIAIEDVREGDVVVSHTGTPRRVTLSTQRQYTGDLFTFHVKGNPFPFTVTADHQVMVVPGGNVKNKKGSIHWESNGKVLKVRAEDVQEGDRMLLTFGMQNTDSKASYDLADLPGTILCDDDKVRPRRIHAGQHMAVICNRTVELDEKLAWLFGLYIAEGSTTKYTMCLSLGSHEDVIAEQAIEIMRDAFSRDIKGRRSFKKFSKSMDVVFSSKIVAKFFKKHLPGNAFNKRIPKEIFLSNRSTRLAFLRGWLDGDGSFQTPLNVRGNKQIACSGASSSDNLIRDIMRLVLSCGLKSTAHRVEKGKTQSKHYHTLHLSTTSILDVYPDKNEVVQSMSIRVGTAGGQRYERTDEGFAVRVTKIEREAVVDFPVYCCQVEEDHSLVTTCLAVGNCNNYVGTGSIKGSGDTAYVRGAYDGAGGHSTGIFGIWDHPNDGPLFLYSNQWPTSTYPKDPAGAGRCCVWIPESEMAKLFQNGGDNGETMALSHLSYTPMQPEILDQFI